MGTSVKMMENFYGKKRMRDKKMATEVTNSGDGDHTTELHHTIYSLPPDRSANLFDILQKIFLASGLFIAAAVASGGNLARAQNCSVHSRRAWNE